MKTFIIVTGISGSGKSTIAKKLYLCLDNSTLLSLDTLKENICDMIGFYNIEQKDKLKNLVYDIYKGLINHCMERGDEILIVEHPFNNSWIPFFNESIEKYKYKVITINIKNNDFNIIFNRIDERIKNNNRHISHSQKIYNPKLKLNYTLSNELDYNNLKKNYDSDKYTSINLGHIINYENNNELEIERLVNTLKNLIKN